MSFPATYCGVPVTPLHSHATYLCAFVSSGTHRGGTAPLLHQACKRQVCCAGEGIADADAQEPLFSLATLRVSCCSLARYMQSSVSGFDFETYSMPRCCLLMHWSAKQAYRF